MINLMPLFANSRTDSNSPSSNVIELIDETYSGDEVVLIDKMQAIWRRSLKYALPRVFEGRLFDVVTCLREGMLNALTHGCERSAEKTCSLLIAYDASQRTLHVRIDDPGSGHHFFPQLHAPETLGVGHTPFGLSMIQHLSDDFRVENEGSTLIFSFVDNKST